MMEWWNALPAAGQFFALVAIPATVVMVLQTILLFIGIGGGGDADAGGLDAGHLDAGHVDAGHFDAHISDGHDAHFESGSGQEGHDGLTLFSIRGIVAFFSVGGWVGLVAVVSGIPVIGCVVLSAAAGIAALFGVAWLMKNALRLQDSGNLDPESLVGKIASVYLSVPPEGKGRGKVTVQTASGLLELDAMNIEPVVIPTGAQAEICALADDGIVLVRALAHTENRGGISKWS